MNYRQATYLTSATALEQLPEDKGIEIAFAGRSNAGKSSAINVITGQKKLARTSKTPGRTQMINLFSLDDSDSYFIVDLPGYGYAKVPTAIKKRWEATLGEYLQKRESLKGLILMMDVRHPLTPGDLRMIDWVTYVNLPVHILLTKSDKLSRNKGNQVLLGVRKDMKIYDGLVTAQLFSSLDKSGVDAAREQLNEWFESAAAS